MPKGDNSKKGHQGFVKLYRNLGDTKHMCVPLTVADEIKRILLLLESIANDKGVDKVKAILNKIEEGLEQVN